MCLSIEVLIFKRYLFTTYNVPETLQLTRWFWILFNRNILSFVPCHCSISCGTLYSSVFSLLFLFFHKICLQIYIFKKKTNESSPFLTNLKWFITLEYNNRAWQDIAVWVVLRSDNRLKDAPPILSLPRIKSPFINHFEDSILSIIRWPMITPLDTLSKYNKDLRSFSLLKRPKRPSCYTCVSCRWSGCNFIKCPITNN